jgi:hypothetical protein
MYPHEPAYTGMHAYAHKKNTYTHAHNMHTHMHTERPEHTCAQQAHTHAHNMRSNQMCDWKSAPYFCSMAVVAACACPNARLVASFALSRFFIVALQDSISLSAVRN